MRQKNREEQAVDSGIAPIVLVYEPVQTFSERVILRSLLQIHSLDLGTLTFHQYRFVAGRGHRGEELVRRHVEKLFEAYTALMTTYNPYCVTVPVYARQLLDGSVTRIFFELLASAPHVAANRLCIELSADLLYEDIAMAKSRLNELRAMGIKVALFEVGEEYCPVFRLSELPFDFIFADVFVTKKLTRNEDMEVVSRLPRFIHMIGAQAYAPYLSKEQIDLARKAEFDGYSLGEPPHAVEGIEEGSTDAEQ